MLIHFCTKYKSNIKVAINLDGNVYRTVFFLTLGTLDGNEHITVHNKVVSLWTKMCIIASNVEGIHKKK